MAMTSTALTILKDCIKTNLAYAKYKIGSTYYTAPLSSIDLDSSGNLVVKFQINPTVTGTITISEVQLYDHSDRLWDSKTESIQINAAQQGVLYLFTYTVTAS